MAKLAVGLIAASACVVAMGSGLNSPSAEARARCGSEGSRTILKTSQVRVFRKRGRTFACRYRTHRAFRLGDLPPFEDLLKVEQIEVAGRFVGYELAFRGRTDSFSEVTVIDLASGRRRSTGSDAEVLNLPEETSGAEFGVTDLQLAPSGAVAWINRNVYLRPPRYEVLKSDSDGTRVVLDTGVAIDPKSLSRTDSKVSWVKDGQAQSASLR